MITARSEFAEEIDDEAIAARARSHQSTVAAASNRPYRWIAVSSATVAVVSGSAGVAASSTAGADDCQARVSNCSAAAGFSAAIANEPSTTSRSGPAA